MGRSYPSRPVVGVGAIILDGDRVLLIERGREPQRGLWSIPGAVRREVREETGLDVDVGEPVEVLDRILHDSAGRVEFHYVLVDYLCDPVGGELRAGDDASDARWVPLDRIRDFPLTRGTAEVIEKAFQMRDAAVAARTL